MVTRRRVAPRDARAAVYTEGVKYLAGSGLVINNVRVSPGTDVTEHALKWGEGLRVTHVRRGALVAVLPSKGSPVAAPTAPPPAAPAPAAVVAVAANVAPVDDVTPTIQPPRAPLAPAAPIPKQKTSKSK